MFLVIPATIVVIVGVLLAAADSTNTTVIHVLACLLGYYVWIRKHKLIRLNQVPSEGSVNTKTK